MRRILKYQIDARIAMNKRRMGEVQLTMPEGAEIRHIESVELGIISLWVECNPDIGSDQIRDFQVFATGDPVISDGIRAREHAYYVGTAVDGKFVWHLFEWH